MTETETSDLEFFAKAGLLDQLGQEERPTAEVADVLAEILQDERYSERFFRDLRNPAWFLPLLERGVFSDPPEPVEAEGGGSRIARWPASAYIKVVGKEYPAEIARLVDTWHTRNIWVVEDIIELSKQLKPKAAVRLAPFIMRSLEADFLGFLPDAAISLVSYLLQGGRVAAAKGLLLKIVEPLPPVASTSDDAAFYFPTARSRLEYHRLDDLMRVMHPAIETYPSLFADVFEKSLRLALTLERRAGRKRSADYSSIWRPAIEDHEQNSGFDYKYSLVTVLRDSVRIEADQSERRSVKRIRRYLRSRLSIFTRIAMHTLRFHVSGMRHEVLETLLSPQVRLRLDSRHELRMLRVDAFALLEPNDRVNVLRLIKQPPPRRTRESEEEYERRVSYRLFTDLYPIAEFLTGEDRSLYDELAAKFPPPENEDFLVWTRSGWSGGDSGPEIEPGTSLAELVRRSMSQMSTESGISGLLEGFGASVTSFVKGNPGIFDADTMVLCDASISNIFHQAILRGLTEAHKEVANLPWVGVVPYCSWLANVKATSKDKGEEPRSGSAVVSELADFIRDLFRDDERAPPSETHAEMLNILAAILANESDPNEAHEAQYGPPNMDPFTLSLNTARGKAFHALIYFALHVARTEDKAKQREASEQVSRIGSKVRQVLGSRLDRRKEKSIAVHSVFGGYFPQLLYLDRGWVLSRLDRIFPEAEAYWLAAFEALVKYTSYHFDIFLMLRKEYGRAIEYVASSRATLPREFDSQLGQHLAIAYWHGREPLTDDSLVRRFFETASDDARGSFVWVLWRALEEVKPDEASEYWGRCINLWEWRARTNAESSQPRTREASSYLWWLDSTPAHIARLRTLLEETTPFVERYGQIGRAIEYLERESRRSIVTSVQTLERVILTTPEPPYLMTEQRQTLREILARAIASAQPSAVEAAERIINNFGNRGDYEFEDLLK